MDGGQPQPHEAADAAQFVAAMRQLRQWAHVSYRELERRAEAAGDVLPRATLAGALSRADLPREELLAAFVRACGGDRGTVEAWVGVRKRLAVDSERRPSVVEASGLPAVAEPSARGLPAAGPEPRSVGLPDPHDGLLDGPGEPGTASTGTPATEGEESRPGGKGTEAAQPAAPAADRAAAVVPAEGERDADTGTAAAGTAVPQEETAAAGAGADTSSAGTEDAGRRLARRRGPLLVAVLAVLLSAGVTGIVLAPDDGSGDPRTPPASTPPPGPTAVVTVTPSNTSGQAPDSTASGLAAEPAGKDRPAPATTRQAPPPTPSGSTARPGRPEPQRTSRRPESTPYEPPLPYDPYEPPPSSTPPAQGGDPFPEETCWDVTNDCV